MLMVKVKGYWLPVADPEGDPGVHRNPPTPLWAAPSTKKYSIAGNFRMVLIFVCSIPYMKIKTAKI